MRKLNLIPKVNVNNPNAQTHTLNEKKVFYSLSCPKITEKEQQTKMERNEVEN